MDSLVTTDASLARRLQSELRTLRAARDPWNTPAPAPVEAKIARVSAELWSVEARLADDGLMLTSEGAIAPIPVPA